MKYTLLFFAILAAFAACEQPKTKSGKALDTPTTGEITIMADEGYKPIIETSIDVFDSIYKQAKINALYVAEGEAVAALVRDSVQVIVITRQLTADEMKFFEARGFKPKITPIAYDALAFIVHPDNRDTVFTKEQMQNILTGQVTKWTELNPKSTLGDIRLVFDHPLSGTVRYVKDSVIAGAALSPNASALKTNEEVISYVAKNKNTLGIISANWISDTDDGGVQKFLKEIKIADIAEAAGKEGYGPYQAYLAKNWYPYKRTVYVINAQARNGLGLGFASYLAADGQRIVLKDGLLPANAVTRLIEVSR
ncbi:MAG: phosphate ABC transporter substrate-binding protein, PhoT family [Haliscomenobacteraceae bacterium CHB4]|nr:Phosphate-binding protein PstS [Saprospiraceae bacterium]MCE7925978.1 phosphate ABC transporter substrate-binding protein, PhoT family [Haliscomenobacteraceae bacterium CHB4]